MKLLKSKEWATSPRATKTEGKQVMNTVLSDGRFWRSITFSKMCETACKSVDAYRW